MPADTYELVPCKLRESRFVELQDSTKETLSFKELVSRFPFVNKPGLPSPLRFLSEGAYVGLMEKAGVGGRKKTVGFVFIKNSGFNDIKSLLLTNPKFPDQLVSVFKVIKVETKASSVELPKQKK